MCGSILSCTSQQADQLIHYSIANYINQPHTRRGEGYSLVGSLLQATHARHMQNDITAGYMDIWAGVSVLVEHYDTDTRIAHMTLTREMGEVKGIQSKVSVLGFALLRWEFDRCRLYSCHKALFGHQQLTC